MDGRKLQPLCPIRGDEALCVGAICAWSRRERTDGGEDLFTCAIASGAGAAVTDRRRPGKDPVERT